MNIHVLTLETADLDNLRTFYSQVLEMFIIEEEKDCFTLGLLDSELEFRRHTGAGHPQYHFAFTIPANKIEEARQWLQPKVPLLWLSDYNSDIADFKNWNARSVYFYDPAGNIVELIARDDLDNEVAEPFSSQQILAISEVGLVFPAGELEQQTNRLMESFQLPFFSRQPPMEHFKALGDDEGLFIIVPENRPWYPTTDMSAAMAPLKIYFSNGITDNWLEYDHELQSWSSSAMRFK